MGYLAIVAAIRVNDTANGQCDTPARPYPRHKEAKRIAEEDRRSSGILDDTVALHMATTFAVAACMAATNMD